ncbi:MAG: sterol desaturase family protein [Bacteroidetes bacterium]|nr:sterol desaturase family protein [Bacteroidota bacterium]
MQIYWQIISIINTTITVRKPLLIFIPPGYLLRGLALFYLSYGFEHFRFIEISNLYVYWIVLFIAEDFMLYLVHILEHNCRLFWAVHVTHHSAENFNLTVSFRASVFQPLYRFIFFIPLTLLGFHPIDIIFIYAISQVWGMVIHNQYIGKLGVLEWVLNTPSHHRVHHGSNPIYLDKNMGVCLIIWDRLFGTYQEELDEEPVRYGLTTPLNSYQPIKVIFHEWAALWSDIMKPLPLSFKLKYIFGKPGWSHDGSRKTSEQLREAEKNLKI